MTDPLNNGDLDNGNRDPIPTPMRSVEETIPVDSTASAAPIPVNKQLVEEPAAATVDHPQDGLQPIQLYEERLVTQTKRIKTGEVKISKRIVTDTASANIPVKKEKIVIEIESIYTGETRIDIGDAQTAEDGSIRMDIYEDQALACREIVPYQNVSVRKEVVADTVVAQEVLRKEELDIVADSTTASGVTTDGRLLVEER